MLESIKYIIYNIYLLYVIFYITIFIEWCLHKLGHINHKYNFIYHSHIDHHKRYYPVGNLLQSAPYKDGKGGYIYLCISLIIWILAYHIIHRNIAIIFIIFSGLFIFISDHLHTQFHIKDSYLQYYFGEWFIKKREYHFEHHRRMDKHLSLSGIYTGIDKLFGTY